MLVSHVHSEMCDRPRRLQMCSQSVVSREKSEDGDLFLTRELLHLFGGKTVLVSPKLLVLMLDYSIGFTV